MTLRIMSQSAMIDVNPGSPHCTHSRYLPFAAFFTDSYPIFRLFSNWVNYWKSISIAKSSLSWPAEMCQDAGALGSFQSISIFSSVLVCHAN